MDYKLRKIFKDWKAESGAKKPFMYKYDRKGTLNIYTSQPGLMIGKAGSIYYNFEERIKTECKEIENISIVESYLV